MAYFSEIELNPACVVPPPKGAEYVSLRYQTRQGLIAESGKPILAMAAFHRAKDLVAAGCRVWYKDVLTYDGVRNG